MPTITLNRPTRARLAAALRDTLIVANGRATARTIDPDGVDLEPVFRSRSGIIDIDGGAVPNSYGYPAEATWLKVSWITRRRGQKVVRVLAGRDYARNVSGGGGGRYVVHTSAERMDHDAWRATEPQRAITLDEVSKARRRAWLDRIGAFPSQPLIGDVISTLSVDSIEAVDTDARALVASDRGSRKSCDKARLVLRDADGYRRAVDLPPRFGRPTTKFYQQHRADGTLVAEALKFASMPVDATA